MADKRVEVEYIGKDKTGKATKSAEANISSLGKIAASVGPLVVAAFGAAVIRESVGLFIRQEKAIAQLDQRIKSTGGSAGFTSKQLQTMASELQAVTTFGDEATIEMQSLLMTFTQISGPVFQRAQESILDVATAMGTDLKSAAIQVGKALNDPKGQLSALSRSGIQFTEDQKALIKSLQETGDIAGAQTVILKELETQFGGAARAARDTFGGSLEAAGNSVGDLGEKIGETIVDITGMKDALEEIPGVMTRLANSLDLFKAYREGTVSFWDWMTANPEEAAELIKGAAEMDKQLIKLQSTVDSLETKKAGNFYWSSYQEKRLKEAKKNLEEYQTIIRDTATLRNVAQTLGNATVATVPEVEAPSFIGPMEDPGARQAAQAKQLEEDLKQMKDGSELKFAVMQADFMRRRNSEQLSAQETIAIQTALKEEEQRILNERISNYQTFSGGLSSLQSGLAANSRASGDALFKASQLTGLAIGAVDTYVAALQAMKDPSKVTAEQKFAAWAAVVGKGLGTLSIMRSITVGGQTAGGAAAGGGGGGGARGFTEGPIAQPEQPTQGGQGAVTVNIDTAIASDDWVQNNLIPDIIAGVQRGATGPSGTTIQVV